MSAERRRVGEGGGGARSPVPPLVVEAVWRGGYAVEVDARGHAIAVDEPVDDGGRDGGPMPTELLCAALASCMCMAVAHVAAKHDVSLPDLAVEVRAEREGRALRYGRFDVVVRSSASAQELEPLLERARRFCWVSNTLLSPPTIDFSIEPAPDTTEVL